MFKILSVASCSCNKFNYSFLNADINSGGENLCNSCNSWQDKFVFLPYNHLP